MMKGNLAHDPTMFYYVRHMKLLYITFIGQTLGQWDWYGYESNPWDPDGTLK